ncbi:MAG: CopD family protein [Phycisphaerales bacterium]|nr:CopD family protein [Phycisphaerales bacterium]
MLHKALVILHLLGAAAWIGGHIVLVLVVLPPALRARDTKAVLHFERGYGRVGLAALAIQIVTGSLLASKWLGGWGNILNFSVPAAHLVLAKLALLGVTLVHAGYAFHRLLPRLAAVHDTNGPAATSPLRRFALHAWITTMLAVLLLIVGASFRLGGIF